MALVLATLPGCFPYVTSYVHLGAPGVQNAGGCAGPTVFATYEAHGARFAVTLEPGLASRDNAGFLRVRAPRDMILSTPVAIGYVIPEGRAAIPFELVRVDRSQARFGDEILERQGLVEHRLEFSGLPPIAFSGTLKLPAVYLDGVAVNAPELRFERRSYAGIAPLNC